MTDIRQRLVSLSGQITLLRSAIGHQPRSAADAEANNLAALLAVSNIAEMLLVSVIEIGADIKRIADAAEKAGAQQAQASDAWLKGSPLAPTERPDSGFSTGRILPQAPPHVQV